MALEVEGEEQPPPSHKVPKERFTHCREQMSSGAGSNSFPKGKNHPRLEQHRAAAVSAASEQHHFGVPPAQTTLYLVHV